MAIVNLWTECCKNDFYIHIAGLPYQSESESEVAQSCPTLCNPMDCSLPCFSVHGCRSPAPASRESAWRGEQCRQKMMGLHVYFKLQVFFYTLTKALGQRFDIFSFPHTNLLPPETTVALQSSCFSNSLRMGFTVYYLLPLMCPILNLWLHYNSCYIPQFISYLSKCCLPLASLSSKKTSSYS